MPDASKNDETAYSVPSTAKTGFNKLAFIWLAVAVVVVLLGILFILSGQPKSAPASPPSHTSLLWSAGGSSPLRV